VNGGVRAAAAEIGGIVDAGIDAIIKLVGLQSEYLADRAPRPG